MPELSSYAWSAIAIAGPLFALWLASLRLRDASIIDIFWGIAFVIIAWTTRAAVGAGSPRAWLAVALTTIWGLRLAIYLAARNLGHGEDKRYAAMRARHGDAWPLRSLFIVFGLQGVLSWIVSLPVQAAVRAGGALRALDVAGALVVLVGVAFEGIADWQLAAFKRDPDNRGRVMSRGLFRYSRHPNYFGDFLVWWGLFAIAASAGALWAVVSPLLMSTLLLRVSGVALLEKDLRKRPGYEAYVARTSAFFPWWPKG